MDIGKLAKAVFQKQPDQRIVIVKMASNGAEVDTDVDQTLLTFIDAITKMLN